MASRDSDRKALAPDRYGLILLLLVVSFLLSAFLPHDRARILPLLLCLAALTLELRSAGAN